MLSDEEFDAIYNRCAGQGLVQTAMKLVESAVLAKLQAQSEPPVGKVIREGVIKWVGKYPDVGTELYAAPVQQEKQK